MANTNYYSWLELPVDQFVNNPVVLKSVVEQKMKEWQSSKSLDVQNRANIHGSLIRKAIQDPVEWEKIYNDYKASVEEKIDNRLMFLVVDDKVKPSDIANLASSIKVSEEYIRNFCISKKIRISDEKAPVKVEFTLDDMKPASHLKIQTIQRTIRQLGEENIMTLLANPMFLGVNISEFSPEDKVMEALEHMKSKWSHVPATGPKGTQKSHLDKVYSGLMPMLRASTYGEYLQYLKYEGAQKCLEVITSTKITELSEKAFNSCVSQLVEFTLDARKAKSVLTGFCIEKKIAYPVERARIAVCPFCNMGFEREEPIQRACPVCGKSLMVACPKCGNLKHLITDQECDGVHIGEYPLLKREFEKAKNLFENFNFEGAGDRLKAICAVWPDFPGSAGLASDISSMKKKLLPSLDMISEYCAKKKYFSAAETIELVDAKRPGFKKNYGVVYSKINSAIEDLNNAKRETDSDKQRSRLLSIYDIVIDYPELNAMLQRYTVMPVTELRADVDSRAGVIKLSWSSANKTNSVNYSVRRKRDTVIYAIQDGEEICNTQGTFCEDKSAEEGVVYYYAVYAYLGPSQSQLKALNEPQMILRKPRVSCTPLDGAIGLQWEKTDINVGVICSRSQLTGSEYDAHVKDRSASGAVVGGLMNGVSYNVAVYKFVKFDGRKFRSELSNVQNITPVRPMEPPNFTFSVGSRDGEYILKNAETSNRSEVVVYCSNEPVSIPNGTILSREEMEKKALILTCEKLPDGTYKINISARKNLCVYPAYVSSSSLTVGNRLELVYFESVKATINLSGTTLSISIDKWPDGFEEIITCYNFDSFPQDITDCPNANKLKKSRADFARRPIIDIPDVRKEDYYITLFARSGTNVVPLTRIKYALKDNIDVVYTVTKTFGGGLKLTFKNPRSYRPAVTFAIGDNCVPLEKRNAVFTCDIPENNSAPENEVVQVRVTGCRVDHNSKSRIFCEQSSYRFIKSGSSKI